MAWGSIETKKRQQISAKALNLRLVELREALEDSGGAGGYL